MERLTKIIDGGVVFPRELVGITLTPDNDYMHKLLKRVAAYEDTGLEPETLNEFAPFLLEMKMNIGAMQHLKELLQAEKDGRLVVLPCKAGTPRLGNRRF